MKSLTDVITVKKKGPNGTGRGEDIQRAINKALGGEKHCVVYVPCGIWNLEEPLRLHPLPSRTPAEAFAYEPDTVLRQDCIDHAAGQLLVRPTASVHLMGARPAYSGQFQPTAFTVLRCQFNDGPAIDIQATRSAAVSNLAIEGQNRVINEWMDATFPNLHQQEEQYWVDPEVTDEHVAIAIDRHPGSGSTAALIDHVSARFFAAGITIGTSGNKCTLNSDGHVIRRFFGQYLGKAGIIIGHRQTKGISVTDSFFYGQQYWIDCINRGLGKGHPPTITGCYIGGTQRLFNLHHAYGAFACHGLFVESTLSLGTIGGASSKDNNPAVFTGCQFNLFLQSIKTSDGSATILRPDSIDTHINSHRPLLFQGCSFKFNQDEVPASGLRVDNFQQLVFDTCAFNWKAWDDEAVPIAFSRLPHPNPMVDSFPYVDFRSCSYWRQGWVGYIHGQPHGDELALGTVQLTKDAEGTVEVNLTGILDIRKGDFIGFFGNHNNIQWTPKYDVPGLSQPYGSLLPFASVAEVVETSGNIIAKLQQVAATIYTQLDTPQSWELFRWRYLV